jgi:glycosyltransferase involved in cell wall biosynthesis
MSSHIRDLCWHVFLYGPGEIKQLLKVKKIIHEKHIEDIISLQDSITGCKKFKILSESKLFIHCSRYEGQPQSVLEAMAYGSAPIITEGNNLSEHFCNNQIGWCVPTNKLDIASAIYNAISNRNLDTLANNAKCYARDNFSWDIAATEFLAGIESIVVSP